MLRLLLVRKNPILTVILETDFVYSMGSNKHGQLGIGEPIDFKNSPVLIEDLPQ
jgi:hypothetical protein